MRVSLAKEAQYYPSNRSILKYYNIEMAFRVIDRCTQCLGGVGLTKDLPLERWLRQVRALRIGDRPLEIHKIIIAQGLFKGWHPTSAM